MNFKWVWPTLTCTALGFAVTFVIVARGKPAVAQPPAQPASAIDLNVVAGTGLVEPESEVIKLSCPVGGLVTRVYAYAGSQVHANDPLFQIDDRDLKAQLVFKKATLKAAISSVDRLIAEPRVEELPTLVAKVDQAKAMLDDADYRYQDMVQLNDTRAVTKEDIESRKNNLESAKAQLEQAKADLQLKQAGAWKPDIDLAKAQRDQSAADVEQTQELIDRLIVRAPVDGIVIQSQVRLGQYANPSGTDSLMLFAAGKQKNVRVQVDENDCWRIKPAMQAYGYVRGNTANKIPLHFVRFEPYVLPKTSLTGDTTERVDTRVLEVIYQAGDFSSELFFGQQMDVYVDTK